MYDQIVGGYSTVIGADPDARALMGGDARYLMGAATPSFNAATLNAIANMHPALQAAAQHTAAVPHYNTTGLNLSHLASLLAPTSPATNQQAAALQQLVQQQQQQIAIMQQAQNIGNPVVVQPQSCLQTQYLPAGFEAVGVLTLATAPVNVRPQVMYRADRLVIPYTGNGEFFSITAFNIGQTNLLVGSGPVPAGTFAENATGMIRGLGLPTNQPVQEINMAFRNNSGATHDIRGAFEGRAVF